ncbi:hypothetical protein OROGR_020125 [Orobanche gracilis]
MMMNHILRRTFSPSRSSSRFSSSPLLGCKSSSSPSPQPRSRCLYVFAGDKAPPNSGICLSHLVSGGENCDGDGVPYNLKQQLENQAREIALLQNEIKQIKAKIDPDEDDEDVGGIIPNYWPKLPF